ncbi:MAG: Gfo/Idh/MocA family oxidoreductase [Candidatus Omnitrophica bacterium]|nr:Gfo/Idh/MocA family oxidoreductase [Candidatus Omnitrophota bacterium]
MTKLNVAIIGLGHLGSKHVRVYSELHDKVNIAAICDHHAANAKPLAEQYHVPFVTDYRKLPDNIQAVNICTPTVTHAEIAKYFLERGVHTFVEKPITMDLDEADMLIELARRNNLKLQVGHVERFNSAFQTIQKIVKDPLFIECHRLNPFPNRSLDIGVVTDLMIHDIDIILGLIKYPIKDIQAVGVPVLTKKEDIANVRLTFTNGSVCNITASRISPEVMRKIRIFLKNAYISLDYVEQKAFIYRKQLIAITKENIPIEKEEPLKKELESFVDCVRLDKPPVVSGSEAREALKVALEITDKIWQNLKNFS